jgi:hypothetical protein
VSGIDSEFATGKSKIMESKKSDGAKKTSNTIDRKIDSKKRLRESLGLSDISLLDDAELQVVLGVSKRQTADLRSRGEIAYIQEKPRALVKYYPSDVKAYIDRYRIPAVWEGRKL